MPTFHKWAFAAVVLSAMASALPAQTTEPAVDTHMRSPADEIATIVLPPGYHLQLVASEPDVICPVICTWDGNGRMFVSEMRSYMLDLNGSNAHTRISRVSRWESTRNDGIYDKHTVYADQLLLPRMVLPLDDRVLIRETDTKDIVSYRDTHGDGVADEKIKVYDGGIQEGNLEHQPSGLVWDIDNWIYVTHQDERFRFTHGKMEKSPLPFHPGQWGLATDDTGQLIFSTAGEERAAHNFQVMPQYGNIDLPDELSPDFSDVYPIEHLTDVEGGLPRLKPGGGLNHFTGCAGPTVFRGDALPADLYGDLIIPEPVGRLVRRAKFSTVNGKRVLTNAYDHQEFIASTDANFRPVWSATGPDGCLYLCDMYHGIIQEANWTRIGSYLRPQIRKYHLENHKGAGRIFRVVYDGMKPRPMPHMLDETPAQWVEHLSDANGWWRDTAQKLLVLRHDSSVIPALQALAATSPNPIARLHAYWTLDGLDSLSNAAVKRAFADPDPRVRAAAVRWAEPALATPGAPQLPWVESATTDGNAAVSTQACLSLLASHVESADAVVDAAVAARPTPGDGAVAIVALYRTNVAKAKTDEINRLALVEKDPVLAALMARGRIGYEQTCIACHGSEGRGTPAPEHDGGTLAPPLRGSRHLLGDRDAVCRIVMAGLTGRNYGKSFPGQMAAFRWAGDESLASILTYARNSWGNKAEAIDPADVASARKATVSRSGPFQVADLFGNDQPLLYAGRSPGDILVDPATAELHGGGLRLQRHPAGMDVGYWEDATNTVAWNVPIKTPGRYRVKALTASPVGPDTFTVTAAGDALTGEAVSTADWGAFAEVNLGELMIHTPGSMRLVVSPASGKAWHPMNLAGIVLTPVLSQQ